MLEYEEDPYWCDLEIHEIKDHEPYSCHECGLADFECLLDSVINQNELEYNIPDKTMYVIKDKRCKFCKVSISRNKSFIIPN